MNTNTLIYLAIGAAAGYAACSVLGKKPATPAAGTAYGMGRRISEPVNFNDYARFVGINRLTLPAPQGVDHLSPQSAAFLTEYTVQGQPIKFDEAKKQIWVGKKNTAAAREAWNTSLSVAAGELARRPETELFSSLSKRDYIARARKLKVAPKASPYDLYVTGGKIPARYFSIPRKKKAAQTEAPLLTPTGSPQIVSAKPSKRTPGQAQLLSDLPPSPTNIAD